MSSRFAIVRRMSVVFRRGLVTLPALDERNHVAVIVVVIVATREFLFMPAVFAFERCGEVAAVLAEYRFDFHGSRCYRRFSRGATGR